MNATQSRLKNTDRNGKWVDISPPRDLYGVNMYPGGTTTSRPKLGAGEHVSEYDKSAYTYAAGASNQIGNRPGLSPQSSHL